MRMKMLTRKAMLRNINGLSIADHAYCGPYGTITCTQRAHWVTSGSKMFKMSPRKFTVAGNVNGVLANKDNWTFKELRKAIDR